VPTTRRREFWNGDRERLPDGFTVTKPKSDHALTAVCEVWTHSFRWKLRLLVDALMMQEDDLVSRAAGECWHGALPQTELKLKKLHSRAADAQERLDVVLLEHDAARDIKGAAV
jgi:hypothetical protein